MRSVGRDAPERRLSPRDRGSPPSGSLRAPSKRSSANESPSLVQNPCVVAHQAGIRDNRRVASTHDLFLSYSSMDRSVVIVLAEKLRDRGLRVWFDEWEIRDGESIPSRIEAGLEGSAVLVLCMSANVFGSAWAELESQTVKIPRPTESANVGSFPFGSTTAIPQGRSRNSNPSTGDFETRKRLNASWWHVSQQTTARRRVSGPLQRCQIRRSPARCLTIGVYPTIGNLERSKRRTVRRSIDVSGKTPPCAWSSRHRRILCRSQHSGGSPGLMCIISFHRRSFGRRGTTYMRNSITWAACVSRKSSDVGTSGCPAQSSTASASRSPRRSTGCTHLA